MRSLLLEGGVAGHMNHLYDNPNLTFRKMKEILAAASDGQLEGTEKTDGQNLQLSYDVQTSTARAARNKGNIKDGGLNAAGLAEKFAGRGEVKEGYEEIAEALEIFEEADENALPSFLELKKVFLKLASEDESLSGLTEVFESFEAEVRGPPVDSRDFKDNRKAFSKSIRKVITHPSALEIAFNEAFATFEETVGNLPIKEREEIFGPNTNIYYNAEVQDPRAANLINYDLPTLTIHRVGHNEYNRETGQATGRDVSKNAGKLAAALGRVQGERQEGKFFVQMNAIKQLEALSDDVALTNAYQHLDSALRDAGISDSQTIAEYMISRVDTMIDGRISLHGDLKMALIKYIFKDRDEGGKLLADKRSVLKLIPKEDTGTIDAVRKIMDDGEKIKFRSIAPIEGIVHDFSVEMLKGLKSAFILDNEAEIERLRAETQKAIEAIEASDSEEAMEILAKQMSKLKDIEGVSTAAEGFVFDYDDVTYKFTGNFAPMNQLLGLFKYGRGSVPPLQKLDEQEGEVKRKIAVFPGAFKPPHKGHMNVVEALLQSGVDQVAILISKLDRKTPAGRPVDRSVSERIWQIYIDSKGLGDRVFVGKSPFNTPVKAAYEVLKGTVPDLIPQPGDLIIPAASDKPDKYGKPDYDRFKNFHKGIDGMIGGVIPANIMEWYYEAPSEAPMSASAFRAALDTGEGLEAFLPTGVDPGEVLGVLGVESSVEEASSMAGGNVAGYAGGNPNKRSLIREEDPEDEVIEEVLNYLLGKGVLS